MPNYASANLVKAQTILTQRFNADELRYRQPVTFLEFRRQTEIMVPSHNLVRTREDRAVESNYMRRSARNLGTGGRTHNHTGTKGDSGVLTHTWVTRDDKFFYSLKQADNSVFTMNQQIANELGNVVANFAEGLETEAASFLFNNRSSVNDYSREGTFNEGAPTPPPTDVFEINEAANGDRAIQITKSAMDFMRYQGRVFTIFADSVAFNKFEKQANQGTGNSENLSFQYSNVNFIKSIDFDADAVALGYTNGFWIAVPEGSISVLDWIPVQNRQGVETKENIYGTFINPVDSLSYATHEYQERSDETANNGFAQDVKTEVEVSVDLSFEHTPLSTANETSLLAFGLV